MATIHYTAVFVILMLEMAILTLLSVPVPASWRRTIFNFVSYNRYVKALVYYMQFVYGFIAVLFLGTFFRRLTCPNFQSRQLQPRFQCAERHTEWRAAVVVVRLGCAVARQSVPVAAKLLPVRVRSVLRVDAVAYAVTDWPVGGTASQGG